MPYIDYTANISTIFVDVRQRNGENGWMDARCLVDGQ